MKKIESFEKIECLRSRWLELLASPDVTHIMTEKDVLKLTWRVKEDE